MEQFLYFPQCKITRADLIPNISGKNNFSLMIKSSKTTPSHYPKHYMLDGKADFFLKLNYEGIVWEMENRSFFKSCFNKDFSLLTTSDFLRKELCVFVLFNPEQEIKLKCIGIGFPHEIPSMFFNDLTNDENIAHSKVAKLNYELGKKGGTKKKQKI